MAEVATLAAGVFVGAILQKMRSHVMSLLGLDVELCLFAVSVQALRV